MSDAEFWNALTAEKDEKNARWAAALGLNPEAEVDPADAGPPDFDAGVRTPTSVPSDPVADHNEFVLDLIARTNGGQR